jgi:hypothetical protein
MDLSSFLVGAAFGTFLYGLIMFGLLRLRESEGSKPQKTEENASNALIGLQKEIEMGRGSVILPLSEKEEAQAEIRARNAARGEGTPLADL